MKSCKQSINKQKSKFPKFSHANVREIANSLKFEESNYFQIQVASNVKMQNEYLDHDL